MKNICMLTALLLWLSGCNLSDKKILKEEVLIPKKTLFESKIEYDLLFNLWIYFNTERNRLNSSLNSASDAEKLVINQYLLLLEQEQETAWKNLLETENPDRLK